MNTILNTRYDFGQSAGGDGIKLVCDIYGVSIRQALEKLSESSLGSPSIPKQQTRFPDIGKSTLRIEAIEEIRYFPLISYLEKRAISLSVAKKYTKEIQFRNRNNTLQKAIAFKNDSGAYEIRNSLFK